MNEKKKNYTLSHNILLKESSQLDNKFSFIGIAFIQLLPNEFDLI